MATRPSRRKARASAPSRATVRFYCQGIGDCHLLKFQKDDGTDFWMLIDCGVHSAVSGGAAFIDAVARDIAATTDRLDVIVGTHEHWDHISGFHTANETFRTLDVGEVWLGWTEDPDDAQAQVLDRFKQRAISALQGAQLRLADAADAHLKALGVGIDSLLGFQFGAKGESVRSARRALEGLAPKVRYLEPSKHPLTIDGLPNLRIHVLGPPRDEGMIRIRTRKGEMYGLAAAMARVDSLAQAVENRAADQYDAFAPFEPGTGFDLEAQLGGSHDGDDPASREVADLLAGHYLEDRGRRIDMDWLGIGADLAIQLDDRTNNSSVVLAFEFVDSGRVLLFTADAQVGSWLSWQDLAWTQDGQATSGPDLLARTVLLKVGHHGSENATIRDKGLELMNDPDLAAFIPTNAEDARKVGWGRMPFGPILDALGLHAHRRVVRADDAWAAGSAAKPPFKAPSGSVRKLRRSSRKGLWIEMDVC